MVKFSECVRESKRKTTTNERMKKKKVETKKSQSQNRSFFFPERKSSSEGQRDGERRKGCKGIMSGKRREERETDLSLSIAERAWAAATREQRRRSLHLPRCCCCSLLLRGGSRRPSLRRSPAAARSRGPRRCRCCRGLPAAEEAWRPRCRSLLHLHRSREAGNRCPAPRGSRRGPRRSPPPLPACTPRRRPSRRSRRRHRGVNPKARRRESSPEPRGPRGRRTGFAAAAAALLAAAAAAAAGGSLTVPSAGASGPGLLPLRPWLAAPGTRRGPCPSLRLLLLPLSSPPSPLPSPLPLLSPCPCSPCRRRQRGT